MAERIGFEFNTDLSEAFKNMTGEGGKFFNLMEKQSASVGGLISTLKGNFSELLKGLSMSNIPLFGSMVSGLNSMVVKAKEYFDVKLSEELEKEKDLI